MGDSAIVSQNCLNGRNSAGLWGLDDLEDPETAAVLQQAAKSPDAFVLKPQVQAQLTNSWFMCTCLLAEVILASFRLHMQRESVVAGRLVRCLGSGLSTLCSHNRCQRQVM